VLDIALRGILHQERVETTYFRVKTTVDETRSVSQSIREISVLNRE